MKITASFLVLLIFGILTFCWIQYLIQQSYTRGQSVELHATQTGNTIDIADSKPVTKLNDNRIKPSSTKLHDLQSKIQLDNVALHRTVTSNSIDIASNGNDSKPSNKVYDDSTKIHDLLSSEIELEVSDPGTKTEIVNTDFASINKRYKIIVGILSVKRTPPTVVRMCQELVNQVMDDAGSYKFLVWRGLSAANGSDSERVTEELRKLPGFEVYVKREHYPQLDADKIRITFNDSLERVKWRTTHVLDYANLLEWTTHYKTDYVMILEDDLKPAKHALAKTFDALEQTVPKYPDFAAMTAYSSNYYHHQRRFAKVLRSGEYGGCALIFKKSIIPGLFNYLQSNPYKVHVYLLISEYIDKVLHLEVYERAPNLFQNISPASSYTGKDQKERRTERLRSPSFEYDEDNKTLDSLPSYGNNYIGCFIDHPSAYRRDLSGLYNIDTKHSNPKLCKKFCLEYKYFGLQNGNECYCGNEFGSYGCAPESECNMPCRRQKTVKCGGVLRNSVYRT